LKLLDKGAFIGSESSSTGQVFKKKEEYESMPHHRHAHSIVDDENEVEEVSRHTSSTK
jgi:hypothetical protein